MLWGVGVTFAEHHPCQWQTLHAAAGPGGVTFVYGPHDLPQVHRVRVLGAVTACPHYGASRRVGGGIGLVNRVGLQAQKSPVTPE